MTEESDSDIEEGIDDIFSEHYNSCKQYTIDEFHNAFEQPNGCEFLLLNQNIRSFHANSSVFNGFLSSLPVKPQFTVLSETWNTHDTASLCVIDGMNGYHTCRATRSGGVSVFVDANLNSSKIEIISLLNI